MSAAAVLIVGGVVLLAAGGLAAFGRGIARVATTLQAAGLALAGVSGLLVLFGDEPVGAGFHGKLELAFGVDGLSGFFLATLAVVGVPALIYARGYLSGASRARAISAISALFLLALAGLLTARDPVSFLASWELITLVPAIAMLVARADAPVRHAVFVYLAVTHLGGAGVWASVLVLAHFGALSDPGALLAEGSGMQAFVIVAALVGFGTKAGLMPLHAWLPRAHPVAPAHLSALMSGVMIKVALYGLVCVLFEWAGPAPAWSGYALLAIGLLSALGGVAYALFQHELKRLLAFHSIENVGIIALGLGASIVLAADGRDTWAAVAFAAALLHTLNHAVFKALLFLGAGAFERAVGSLELDRLGGLLRLMPWTGAAFLVGAAAIASVPPLNGFASEWLTLQALIALATQSAVGAGVAGALATAGLAATAALALYCFAKVIGLVLLGPPRRPEVAAAAEAPLGMRAPMLVLAGLCVALGVAPGALVPALAELAPQPAELPAGAGLSIPGTGSLPSPWLAVGLLALVGGLWWLRGARRAAPAPAWSCGQDEAPALLWTSAGFTKPLRLVFERILRPQRDLVSVEANGTLREVRYSGEVPHLFDTALYAPARRRSLAAARVARRLQSGSVRTYAAYLLGTLILLLAALRLGVLG